MSDDSPGIKLPPPVIFLASILLGFGIDRGWPMRAVPEGLATPLGVVFVVAAFALAFAAFREMRRHRTSPRPDQPASAIVQSGPFRWTRNPIYVALSLLQLGIGLWTNTLWVVVTLLPVWVVMTTQIIAREEAYLERAFGDEYVSYKAAVRRWL